MLRGMKTYSQDLREKMLAAVDGGMPRKEAVSAFGVSPATLKRRIALGAGSKQRAAGAAPVGSRADAGVARALPQASGALREAGQHP